MDREIFLEYSAKDNMINLRKAYNQNENVERATLDILTKKGTKADLEYLKFVLEQGYSGYTFFLKEKFDTAFTNIMSKINKDISIVSFMDIISEELSFITDGHLALTSSEHSVGFYRHLDAYVTEMKIIDEVVELTGEVELLPSFSEGRMCYLIAQKSYNEINSISVNMDGVLKELPTHKIKSSLLRDDKLIEFKDVKGIAYVRGSTFRGDNESDLQALYEVGKKCSEYKDVIWDLSNNSGGNSEFAEMFIKGLNGICISDEKVYQLQSALVHAKETGEIKNIPYSLKTFKEPHNIEIGQFKGHLHIIINDRVASSGENTLTMCDCIETKTVYGCNSLGIGKFGDLMIYYLPYSNITVWCPHKVFDTKIIETKGYNPDIWLDTNNPMKEIIKIIG